MKKYILLIITALCLSQYVCGQSMSDQQILKMAVEAKRSGASDTEIAAMLLKNGATMEQIQRMRQNYSTQISKRGLDYTVDNAIDDAQNRMRTNNEPSDNRIDARSTSPVPGYEQESLAPSLALSGKRVFGRDIFNNKSLTFEPQMNIATPQNYVLGPGDQVVVDVYGVTQESNTLTVSPDGAVTIPNVGPVQVSGLTVPAAQRRIRQHMGKYYTDSEIKVTVGQTRTIVINVMGEVRTPGTYTLSAFATVFHALYKAGGISELGTLRNIKVYRQGRLISVVDVYEFILNGRLAGNVHLQDNDVIQVGAYDCIVDIAGQVKRPMAYEMRKNESLQTLLRYSGGFTGEAYKKSLRVQRKNGKMKSVHTVDEFDWSDFHMEDGDSVYVEQILDRYENMVEVKGAVFRPGMYQLGKGVTSVRTLIERADGLTEEALTSRAVMRRMKANRTQEVLSVDLEGILNGTVADIPLRNEDVLFIPTISDHQNLRTLTITGEVIFPGTYEYADNMTLEDFILQAGGLTDKASTAKVDVSRRFRNPDATEAGMEIAKTYSFSLKDNYVVDDGKNFLLEPYDIVQVRQSPVFQEPIRVYVGGEVAFRGTYTMEQKNQRLSDVIRAAGGVIPGAYVRGARLVRTMTRDQRARMEKVIQMARMSNEGKDSLDLDKLDISNTYSVGIHLDEALAHPGSSQDIELMDGDSLDIPRFNHTIRITGDVLTPNTVAFEDGKDYKYYVEQAGGFGNTARKRHTYIVYQNGTVAMAKKAKIEPGCEVIVPTKAKSDMTVAQWIGIGSSMAAFATMFATIAHLFK